MYVGTTFFSIYTEFQVERIIGNGSVAVHVCYDNLKMEKNIDQRMMIKFCF